MVKYTISSLESISELMIRKMNDKIHQFVNDVFCICFAFFAKIIAHITYLIDRCAIELSIFRNLWYFPPRDNEKEELDLIGFGH